MPLQYSFKQDYVLYADKVALSEAARDLRQRTLEEFHSIFSIVVKQKACYASSLLVRFFLDVWWRCTLWNSAIRRYV